jgi:hypothetical protein
VPHISGTTSLRLKAAAMGQLILNIFAAIAMAAAAGFVVLGVINMVRGGDGWTSQKLMRARVIAQFVAIVLLMSALFLFGGNHAPA